MFRLASPFDEFCFVVLLVPVFVDKVELLESPVHSDEQQQFE